MDLNHITLPVRNMEDAVQFYLVLGFIQIVDTPHYARFACPVGRSTFSLSLESEQYSNSSVVYFESRALDILVEELTARGVVFDQMPVERGYLWKEAVVLDPSGNKIKFYWAGENRLNPPWKVEKRY